MGSPRIGTGLVVAQGRYYGVARIDRHGVAEEIRTTPCRNRELVDFAPGSPLRTRTCKPHRRSN